MFRMALVNPFSLYRSFAFAGILFLRMGSCSQHQMLRREIRGDASQQEPQPEALHQRSTPLEKQTASRTSAHRTAPPEDAASTPSPPPAASSTSFTQMKTAKTQTTRQSTTQGDKVWPFSSTTVSSTTPAPPSLRQAAREYVLGVNSLQTRYEASAREAHNADEVRQQVGHDLVNAGQEYQKADRKFRESVKQASN